MGTYGTAYKKIYSDTDRITLLDTLSITLHTSKKNFRHGMVATNYSDGTSGRTFYGQVSNLDLQEDAGVVIQRRRMEGY